MLTLRRLTFALVAVSLALLATGLFFTVITSSGANWIHSIQIALLFLCCFWLAWGFATATAGVLSRPTPARSASAPWRGESRTAVLMPIYNEDCTAVFARVAAMLDGLRRIDRLQPFDFYVLSDSTRPEAIEAEARGLQRLMLEAKPAGHLYYRHREKNVGRKAGNIADFIRNNGGAYEYMLVLDADSLMRPETMVEMVARMDAAPEVALLQSQPLIIGRRTLFGRALQFSAALYSPIFSRGIAALQGSEGPFWGHNAIIRVKAFAACCGLPALPGKPPLGGEILSHDTVEAALLARAGYTVRLDPDLGGSYEEAPANLIEYAKRDRRWCQGNLQHASILGAPRLRLWSRISIASGIMAYVASPIWLLFLVASLLDPVLMPEPDYFPADSLYPVFPQPETGKALLLLLGLGLLLVLPKTIISFSRAFSPRRREFGGTLRVLAGATVELFLTSILAPIMMMFQSKSVAEILIGADSGWPSTDRADGGLPFGTAFKASWWMVLAGLAVFATALYYAPALVYWTLPICLPLMAAPALISLTGDPWLGEKIRRTGLLETPFERGPETVLRDAPEWERRLADAAPMGDNIPRGNARDIAGLAKPA